MPDQPSTQEVMASQGTRKSDVPPWMSYAAEFEEKLSPQLEAEVQEYAQHRHGKTSSQNDEELCRQRELNTEVAKQYQWLTPEEYADEAPRIGKVMHSSTFINLIKDNVKDKCWFYRQHPHRDKLTLVYSDHWGTATPQVACWVQAGNVPEYSFMRFDRYGAPLAEKRRGWRTCLLQLILKGLISEQTAKEVFGEATGPASERFNRTLYAWRQNQYEQEEQQQ